MEWILSSKGKKKLSYKGYIYVFQKDLADSVKSYECELRRNHDCKAKVKVKNEAVVGELHNHTHGPDGRTVKVIKVLNNMKTKAQSTQETP